jgi:hypothetical protein
MREAVRSPRRDERDLALVQVSTKVSQLLSVFMRFPIM